MLPDLLSIEQSIEFLKRANLLPYEIFEYTENEKFTLIWLIKEKDYLRKWSSNSLIFGTSLEDLFEKTPFEFLYKTMQENLEIQILPLDQMTDYPQLLLNLIQQNPYDQYIHYDKNTHTIHMDDWFLFERKLRNLDI